MSDSSTISQISKERNSHWVFYDIKLGAYSLTLHAPYLDASYKVWSGVDESLEKVIKASVEVLWLCALVITESTQKRLYREIFSYS